jgi:ribonuclease G
MIDKVRKILGLPSRKTGNKLVLSVEKLETRVALLEGGRLEEYSVERKSSRNIVGSVYKGKVKNIEMGLKAMFVDIGFEKNAFLHFWDAIPAALDSGIEEIDRRSNKRPRKRITVKDIPSIYPVGSDVIVQVTKGPIGTKGPRVTTNLSFAGRYLVLMPFSDRSGISRKIEEPKERERLRKVNVLGILSAICEFCWISGPKSIKPFGTTRRRAACLKNPIWSSAPSAIFLPKKSMKSFATIAGQPIE